MWGRLSNLPVHRTFQSDFPRRWKAPHAGRSGGLPYFAEVRCIIQFQSCTSEGSVRVPLLAIFSAELTQR